MNMTSHIQFVLGFSLFLIPGFNLALPQLPDGVVTDLRLQHDAEADAGSPSSSRMSTSRDPYNIGHGLKTDAEIAELRRRKRGKPLASYHRRQNDVRISSSFSFYSHAPTRILTGIHTQLIASLLKPMEEHTEDARNDENLSRLPVSPRQHAHSNPNQGS
jgi:hypothetical protein